MVVFSSIVIIFGMIGVVFSAPPEVSCPVPISPEHGQTFLYREGQVVKYVCEPGYALKGKELVRCVNGQWEDPKPTCLEFGADLINKISESDPDPLSPVPPARPLFNWGQDFEQDENQEESNSTSDDMPLSDEARIRFMMYPNRRSRIVTSAVRTGNLRSTTELEEEEKKRSQEGKSDSPSTIRVEPPPSVMYVRRTIMPGKSEASRRALEQQYKRAASFYMNVDNGHDVQLVNLPRATVSGGDKGQHSEQTLRQLYWHANHDYPRQASYVEYQSGSPVVMTLTESQLAWINSLHPELRDRYLKDLYAMRAEEVLESERAQAFLRRHEDAYNYYYHMPYYRQPVSLIMEDPINSYDYTCHESGQSFVKAPRLRNMHIQRYDRRQNPNSPYNNYLSAVYRCNPGYVMLDTQHTELHCSKKDWVGVRPICVRKN